MKRLFYYIFITYVAFSTLGLSSILAQDAETDFKFYKKHGHSSKAWNEYVEQGFIAYHNQNCQAAVRNLKEAVSLQAQDALVYFKLAVCSELMDSPYTAIQYYQLAQEKLQKLPAVHRYQKEIFENYGRALFKAGKEKEAMPYLTRAAVVGTPSFALYYMVGTLYGKKNDWPAAREYFQKALTQDVSKIEPKLLSQVYFEVAKVYYEAKDLQNASKLLDKAIQLDPTNQQAMNMRASVNTGLQQKSMVDMLQNLSEQNQAAGEPTPQSAPPPPAAAKLPPLDGGSTTDPTPPMGQVNPAPAPSPSPAPPSPPPSN